MHERYRERLLGAGEDDTVHLECLFDIGWPNAPHRVLRNPTVTAWEAAGRPPAGNARARARSWQRRSRADVVRYSAIPPMADVEGDLDALPMWAGQGVAQLRKIQPAAEIVQEIHDEAHAILERLGAMSC